MCVSRNKTNLNTTSSLLQSSAMQQGVDSINQLLEGFMGINDSELGKIACSVWTLEDLLC